MFIIFNFRDHNFKRAVDACLAASQKLSDTKITDLDCLLYTSDAADDS